MKLSREKAMRGAKSAIEFACICLDDADDYWIGAILDLQAILIQLNDKLDNLEEEK